MIYATLQHEFRQLENEGYQCLIIGDFNAHVGGPPEGIEGNHGTINSNGKRLLNFVNDNNLEIVNKNKSICPVTCTRNVRHSKSLLDYALVSKTLMPKVIRMGIDNNVELLSGSDHHALRIDLKTDPLVEIKQANENKIIKLDEQRDNKFRAR